MKVPARITAQNADKPICRNNFMLKKFDSFDLNF